MAWLKAYKAESGQMTREPNDSNDLDMKSRRYSIDPNDVRRIADSVETITAHLVAIRECIEGWRAYLQARAIWLCGIAVLLFLNLDPATQAAVLAALRAVKPWAAG